MPNMAFNLLRRLYTICFYLVLPFLLIKLFIRVIKNKNRVYLARIYERFGFCSFRHHQTIWLHAVSLGEVNAAQGIIENLLKKYPLYSIVVTSTTLTGSNRIKTLFGNAVSHSYLPYDISFFLKQFIKRINPCLVIIMETEIWPNMLCILAKNKIPLMLANARLSERSCFQYQKIKFFISPLMQRFNLIAAQTQADRERFLSLGASSQQVIVAGNIKFDINLPEDLSGKVKHYRERFSPPRQILVAASTHEGEEILFFKLIHSLRASYSKLLFIIIPRHPERFNEVYRQALLHNLNIMKWSQNHNIDLSIDVLLIDAMGELFNFYAMADLVFVGGSMIQLGGHNILEPALLAKPILTGPYVANFAEIVRMFKAAEALIQIHDENDLKIQLVHLLNEPFKADRLGQNAYQVLKNNAGGFKGAFAVNR